MSDFEKLEIPKDSSGDQSEAEQKIKKELERGAESEQALKFKLDNLKEGLFRLARMARDQEQRRMNPSVDAAMLSGALRQLEETLQQKEINGDAVAGAIRGIVTALSSEPAPQRSVVNTSEDEVSKEMFFVKDSGGIAMTARSSFGATEEGQEVAKSLRQVEDILEKRWNMLARKRELLRRYHSHR